MNEEPDGELMYRFRHFQFSDSEEHKREPERILCDSQLWCADPRLFNDPFDCRPNLIMTDIPIDEAIRRAGAMIRRRGLPEDHPQAIAVMQSAREGKFSSPEMRDALRRGMQESIDRSSVCCFNRKWDDPRMWAQYADNHRGYCLAFELNIDWPEDAVPFHVKYVEDRPEIDLAADTTEGRDAAKRYIDDSIFTKSIHWRDEQEVRIFRPDVPAGLLAFPPSALKAVYLGLQIDPLNLNRIVAAVSKREQRIPVYKLRLHPTRYDFELQQVS